MRLSFPLLLSLDRKSGLLCYLVDLHVIEEVAADVDAPGVGVDPRARLVGGREEHAVEVRGGREVPVLKGQGAASAASVGQILAGPTRRWA